MPSFESCASFNTENLARPLFDPNTKGLTLLQGAVVVDSKGHMGLWDGFGWTEKRSRPGWDITKLSYAPTVGVDIYILSICQNHPSFDTSGQPPLVNEPRWQISENVEKWLEGFGVTGSQGSVGFLRRQGSADLGSSQTCKMNMPGCVCDNDGNCAFV